MPGNNLHGDDRSFLAAYGHGKNNRDAEDTKTRDHNIKIEHGVEKITKDGIDSINSVPSGLYGKEPGNDEPVVKESKQAPQNKHTKHMKFNPIKQKQWKPFNGFSSQNNELYAKKNISTVEKQLKNSPGLDGNDKELVDKNAKGPIEAQIKASKSQVSKPKRQKSTKDSIFTIPTRNRFNCLVDEEILELKEFESEKERKEINLNEKTKKNDDLEKTKSNSSKKKVCEFEMKNFPDQVLKKQYS